ncbi:hypothetical protein D3C86_1157230 [compost metagenome]
MLKRAPPWRPFCYTRHMQISSWQFIHLALSVVFAVLIFLLIKLSYFRKNRTLQIASLAIVGLLLINSFGAFLAITNHYSSLGL